MRHLIKMLLWKCHFFYYYVIIKWCYGRWCHGNKHMTNARAKYKIICVSHIQWTPQVKRTLKSMISHFLFEWIYIALKYVKCDCPHFCVGNVLTLYFWRSLYIETPALLHSSTKNSVYNSSNWHINLVICPSTLIDFIAVDSEMFSLSFLARLYEYFGARFKQTIGWVNERQTNNKLWANEFSLITTFYGFNFVFIQLMKATISRISQNAFFGSTQKNIRQKSVENWKHQMNYSHFFFSFISNMLGEKAIKMVDCQIEIHCQFGY